MHTSSRGGLVSLSLSMLLAALGTSIANVGLPSLTQTFNASFHATQWVVLAYLLAITAVIVSAGRLGDRLGRRRLLIAGLLLFALACGLCGAAPSLPWLIAARTLQGLGAAIMMAMTLAMVGDTVTRARTARAMGLLGTMSAVGTAMGPGVGGLLLSAWGWRALFLVGAPLGLLAAALACRYLPVDQPPVPLATGARFWRSLQSASLRAGLAMSALVSAVIMATFVVGPFYLSRGLDLDPASMGLAMAIGALSLCLTSGLVTYLGSLITLTAGYSLFQAANNTAVMSAVDAAHRGTISGLLNLSRNLGLIFGASVLGAMFAWTTPDLTQATPQSVADGLHATFALAFGLILLATAMAWQRQNRCRPT